MGDKIPAHQAWSCHDEPDDLAILNIEGQRNSFLEDTQNDLAEGLLREPEGKSLFGDTKLTMSSGIGLRYHIRGSSTELASD